MDKSVGASVTEEDYLKIKNLAEREGESVSGLIKNLLRREISGSESGTENRSGEIGGVAGIDSETIKNLSALVESLRELLSGIEKKIGGLGERLAVIENQQKVSMAAISSNLPALATPPSGAKKSQSQVAEKRAWKQVWEKLMDLLSGESSTGWVLGTLIFLLVIIAVALWI